jgi:ATP-dependent RNA helicase DeaD
MMRLTYKIFPIEKSLPSARELKSREEADLVNLFVSAFAERQMHPDDLALARRVMSHEQAERVVAGLLRDHLGARPEAAELATAERRAKRPRPVPAAAATSDLSQRGRQRGSRQRSEAPPDEGASAAQPVSERAEQPRREQPKADHDPAQADRAQADRAQADRAQADRAQAGTPRSRDRGSARGRTRDDRPRNDRQDRPARARGERQAAGGKPERASGEIFVNVGRRDGAEPQHFEEILEDQGFESEEIGYVRVRQSHTFVGVTDELMRRALNALDGATISGRKAAAEPARSKDAPA